jgi:transcriptional regulatory protein RtcR
MPKTVAISLLGTSLDAGSGPQRWERWRPTVSLCRHEDLVIDRLELLHQARYDKLAAQVTSDIEHISPETTVKRHLVEFKDPWDFQEVYAALLDWARGYAFNPEKENYLVHITTGTHVAQICLFLLTEARYLPARIIQTAPPSGGGGGGGGAEKGKGANSAGNYNIIDLDLSKYDRLASRFRQQQSDSLSFLKGGIETKSAGFNKLIEQIEKVAVASKSPLLLMGPTGAGKSLLARRIFELKKSRRQLAGNFVDLNCATLRGDAAMSALFGHTKGAFTGAINARPGLLRAADGGVLFLDEIGELGLDEQAMLLRAVEEKRFLPVGSDVEAQSNFQLIAGTNRDLSAEVARGRFREDLFARINLWTFRLPALRDRREDIEPNILFELTEFSRAQGVNVTFNKEARESFLSFAKSDHALWTANFRDLSAAISRMATLATSAGSARITEEIVEEEIANLRTQWSAQSGALAGSLSVAPGTSDGFLSKYLTATQMNSLDRFDRLQLEDVLRTCLNSTTLSDAGRSLFASSRKKKKNPNDADRLRKYLARFDIDWSDLK